MTKTAETIAAIRHAYIANIGQLEMALSHNKGGYVHVWPKYWIGVKVNQDVCHGVSIELATIVHRSDRRCFRNGNNEPTILMSRSEALQRALVDAKANFAEFEARLVEV